MYRKNTKTKPRLSLRFPLSQPIPLSFDSLQKIFLLSVFLFSFPGLLAQSPQRLSLDGTWEILFDEENQGREANWMKSDVFAAQAPIQRIQVPIAWETLKEDYEGVAFYKKEFNIPADWKDKVVRIHFGAVNYLSEIWLNGEVVGFHEGGFTPFSFRIDEMMKAGEENVLTLRVVGPLFLSDKEIDGMKALETPQWRGGISGGIWQSVSLSATGATYVHDVFIEPNINLDQTKLHVSLDYTGIRNAPFEIKIRIKEATSGIQVATVKEQWELHSGKNKKTWKLTIPDAKYWSPDHPHLYIAEIDILHQDQISDQWTTRFGMRELTIKNKDFYLNGERIYIKASFFEGLYPNKIAYPDSEEMARKEIRLAKEAGFNMIRPWRRPPVPMWLDLADEMGVLVVGSPALECMRLPFSTPYLPSRVENEIRQAILRDRNRACVVQWELFNELHRPVLKQMMRPMAMLARDLDPTRLILDESGGWAYGANMYLPYDYEATKFNDIHNYPGPFINKDRYDGYLSIGLTPEEKKEAGLSGKTPGRNVLPGLMSYVSELGYGSLPDLTVNNATYKAQGNSLTPSYRYHHRIHEGQKRILQESGFAYLYPDMQQFYLDQQSIHGVANKRMIEAVRANPEVDGYCIHALVAGDWILGAGLLDLWRNPKSYAYQGTKAANQARILSIRTTPRNIYAEQGTSLEVLGVNELEEVGATLEVEIISPRGKRLYKKKLPKKWEAGVSQLFMETISTNGWKGTHWVKVKILDKHGKELAENQSEIEVFRQKDLHIPKQTVAVWEEKDELSSFLKSSYLPVQSFSSSIPSNMPVLVSGDYSTNEARLADLFAHAEAGGTVILLKGMEKALEETPSGFPIQARTHPSVGLWTCIPHLVREHPIFHGLPSNTMMRDLYENVWARKTLRDLKTTTHAPVNTLVGSMGFDWFSVEHKMHYSGPGDEWWGSDVAEIPIGKGKCLISQLRIVENLGKDPVADKILLNIIRYATRNKK